MSLSIEIRVNGHPVAVLVASNVGPRGVDVCEYRAALTVFGGPGKLSVKRDLDVVHAPSKGIVALSAALLERCS